MSTSKRTTSSLLLETEKLTGHHLRKLDLCLLIHFLRLSGNDSLRVLASNNELATYLRRTDRTVQTSCHKLVCAGLIRRQRVDPDNQFSPVETILQNKPLIERIKRLCGNSFAHPPKKSSQGRKGKAKAQPSRLTDGERFPFRHLRDESRRVTELLTVSLEEEQGYWDWLSKALGSAGIAVTIKAVAQKRLLSSGERGGLVPNLYRYEPLSGTKTPRLHSFATALESTFHEGTYSVVEADHPLLLVDDVRGKYLEQLPEACALIETSPGNFQATLVAPRNLSAEERLAVQRALIALVHGDPAANTRSQLRRFPGSVNNKASLAHAFISNVHSLPDALTLSEAELAHLLRAGENRRTWPLKEPRTDQCSEGLPSVEGQRSNSESQDPSAADFGHAIELLRNGKPKEHIIGVLINRAARRSKYGKGPGADEHRKYAELTFENARRRFRTATFQTRQTVAA